MLNHVFAAVVSMQAMACYVIVLVLLLRFFLRKQPKSYSYALWSVVLFRLLCPFSFPSPWSLIPQQAKSLANMGGRGSGGGRGRAGGLGHAALCCEQRYGAGGRQCYKFL